MFKPTPPLWARYGGYNPNLPVVWHFESAATQAPPGKEMRWESARAASQVWHDGDHVCPSCLNLAGGLGVAAFRGLLNPAPKKV